MAESLKIAPILRTLPLVKIHAIRLFLSGQQPGTRYVSLIVRAFSFSQRTIDILSAGLLHIRTEHRQGYNYILITVLPIRLR